MFCGLFGAGAFVTFLVLFLSSVSLSWRTSAFPATMELNVTIIVSYVSCFKFAENPEDATSSSAPNKFKSMLLLQLQLQLNKY